jgi:hypothetical protein
MARMWLTSRRGRSAWTLVTRCPGGDLARNPPGHGVELTSIVVDSTGRVFVGDSRAMVIRVFSREGAYDELGVERAVILSLRKGRM